MPATEMDSTRLREAVLASKAEQVILEQLEIVTEGGRVIVYSPDVYVQNQLGKSFKARIQEGIREICGEETRIAFSLRRDVLKDKPQTPVQPTQMVLPNVEHTSYDSNGLNPRFLFEDFVVGKSNAFAYQAAMAASEGANISYNPIYYYSDTGLGKSHISHAIGNRLLEKGRKVSLRYLSARAFAQDYVYATQNNTIDELRKTLRCKGLDLFFMDDLHFLSKKEKVQAELTGILDDLIGGGTQVVLSGFKPPATMSHINKGLISRISCGLAIDIRKPDHATRAAICKAKAEKEGVDLHDDVADLIAARITENVRELESAIRTLSAMASLMKREINTELVQEFLGEATDHRKTLTIHHIQDIVCRNYGLDRDVLCSASRKKEILHPRHIAIYLCRRLTDETLETIGEAFSRRHTSVINALEVIDRQIKENLSVKKEIDYLFGQVGA